MIPILLGAARWRLSFAMAGLLPLHPLGLGELWGCWGGDGEVYWCILDANFCLLENNNKGWGMREKTTPLNEDLLFHLSESRPFRPWR